jgi:hypothetical protein
MQFRRFPRFSNDSTRLPAPPCNTDAAWIRWAKEVGARNTAALITLLVIAHHADAETGIARLTYDDIQQAASLSRSLISAALDVLEAAQLLGT